MRAHHRRGSALFYAMAVTFVIAGFVALAVDWGRVQLTKSELNAAAVAAARYAVAGLQNDINGDSAAAANAAASVRQNKANGRPIVFNTSQDVAIGKWDKKLRTFTVTADLDKANAVQVTLRCTAARGSAVPMTFLSMLGRPSQDVTAVSVAMIDYTGNVGGAGNGRYEYFVPATSNPWLSGMPSGSKASTANAHSNPDTAGTPYTDTGDSKSMSRGSGFTSGGSTNANSSESNYANWGDYASKKASPIQAGGISIDGGDSITFDGINGGANNASSNTNYTGDGGGFVWNVPTESYRSKIYSTDPKIASPNLGAENGIANVKAPINASIGVFLDDNKPTKGALPEALNFDPSGGIGTDFKTLAPKLKQPFFIGDGRTSDGEVQQFIAPDGATRLFICTMDEYEWSNNQGGFYVTAHAKGKIITVK